MSTVAPADARLGAPERWATGAWALGALALGLTVTFVADHSARFGLLVFGVFAIVSAVPLVVLGVARQRRRLAGRLTIVRAVVSVAAGVTALVLLAGASVALLVALVSGWALVTGAVGVVEGILDRRRDRASARDALLLGALTVLLALVLLVIPPDFVEPWRVVAGGTVQAEGAVTTGIAAVGLLGAWAIVAGVLQAIAAIGAADRSPAPGVAR